jgi:hypothetical protein
VKLDDNGQILQTIKVARPMLVKRYATMLSCISASTPMHRGRWPAQGSS